LIEFILYLYVENLCVICRLAHAPVTPYLEQSINSQNYFVHYPENVYVVTGMKLHQK